MFYVFSPLILIFFCVVCLCSKQMVLDLLDKHCREVNENVEGDGDAAVPLSEFDFLYLPIDFRSVQFFLIRGRKLVFL